MSAPDVEYKTYLLHELELTIKDPKGKALGKVCIRKVQDAERVRITLFVPETSNFNMPNEWGNAEISIKSLNVFLQMVMFFVESLRFEEADVDKLGHRNASLVAKYPNSPYQWSNIHYYYCEQIASIFGEYYKQDV